MDHDDPLCFYNFMLFGFKSGSSVGLEKEKFFVHYALSKNFMFRRFGIENLNLNEG